MRKHLTDAEYDALKAHLADTHTREARVLELMLRTGARQGEVLLLNRGSLDAITGSVYIKGTKNSKDRRVPLGMEALPRFTALFGELSGKQMLGNLISDSHCLASQTMQIRRLWESTCRELFGSVPVTLHALRHTFARKFYAQVSRDLLKTQKILGHKNMNSTVAYMHELEIEDLVDDVLKAVGT